MIRLLDDPATLRAARDDPAGFVEHDGLMVIDEVQLAPELFQTIKVAADTDPRPGRFLLTGSAQVLACQARQDTQARLIDRADSASAEEPAAGHGAGIRGRQDSRRAAERLIRVQLHQPVSQADQCRPAPV